MTNLNKQRIGCLNCNKEPARSFYKYCSNFCQLEYQRGVYIKKWKDGKISGLSTLGLVSSPVKIYLRKKYGNKCSVCGWSEINIRTKQVPLVADHIDGNWRNNTEENLRLICPNCDAVSPTYAALNKGNGRINRAQSKRSEEAKRLINKPN